MNIAIQDEAAVFIKKHSKEQAVTIMTRLGGG